MLKENPKLKKLWNELSKEQQGGIMALDTSKPEVKIFLRELRELGEVIGESIDRDDIGIIGKL